MPLARLGTDEVGGGLFLAVWTAHAASCLAVPWLLRASAGRTRFAARTLCEIRCFFHTYLSV